MTRTRLTLLGLLGLTAFAANADERVIALVAQNRGTEPADLLVPYAVLASAGQRVVGVTTEQGSVWLHPGDVQVELPQTLVSFDAAHPRGADYVIVPAVHDPKDRKLHEWLRAQHAKGAVIMSICDGAKVVAQAGLFDGRTATAHWYARASLEREFPRTAWLDDRRYVFDETVASTAGVSASLPAAFALLERRVGSEAAMAHAARLGVVSWSADHEGERFKLSARAVGTAAVNFLAFWRHEARTLEVYDGVDEATLALAVDAYSRTYRSQVHLTSVDGKSVETRHGLRLRTQKRTNGRAIDSALLEQPAGRALDATLTRITEEYGARTADFVALQLEYSREGD